MKILNKLFYRSPFFTTVIVLLLSVAIAFSTIGFSVWFSVKKQMEDIDSGYTSIAIPYNSELPGFMPTANIMNSQSMDLSELLQNAPMETRLDQRVLLGVCVADKVSLTTDAFACETNPFEAEIDEPYNVAVFAVRCDSVETVTSESIGERYDSEGNFIESYSTKSCTYDCRFSVEKVLCMIERDYPKPENLICQTAIQNLDGTAPFEEGKTYLVRGRYYPVEVADKVAEMPMEGILYLDDGAVNHGLVEVSADGWNYQILEEGVMSLYASYTGELDEFLKSSEGEVWEKEIIPAIEKNYSSAKLMLTDNVDSMYWFNVGEAAILEGRSFLEEEYLTGQDVCLVSLEYAQLNGLNVGDELNMELYHPAVGAIRSVGMDEDGNFVAGEGGDETYIQMDPCLPDNSMELKKNYTIVGIYTAPVAVKGTFAFGADTIFVPKSSVPEADAFKDEGKSIPLLNSIMIENGSSTKFEEYMQSQGVKEGFLYFDQGYSEMDGSIQTLNTNAVRLLLSGVGLFLITLCVFLFLIVNKLQQVVVSMRKIGVSAKCCWWQLQKAVFPVVLCGGAVGTLLAVCLFDVVCKMILSRTIELSVAAVALCAGIQLTILLLAGVVCFRILSQRKLMQKDKKRRK